MIRSRIGVVLLLVLAAQFALALTMVTCANKIRTRVVLRDEVRIPAQLHPSLFGSITAVDSGRGHTQMAAVCLL